MRSALALVAACLTAPALFGQAPPRLTGVFPLGAQAGTAVEVAVSGYDLDAATGLHFTHPGLAGAFVAEPPEPKPDPKAKKKEPKKKDGPVSTRAARVTVAAGVPAGAYDVRVTGPTGGSNPRFFHVGTRPETVELEPNDDAIAAEPFAALGGSAAALPRPNLPRAQRVALGSVVHGVISSGTDVDYAVFAAKAGERVLIHCAASSVESRARPLVEVFDAGGQKVAANRNHAGTDALVDFTATSAGDHFIRVTEFAYLQGGPDHFYRLTVGQTAWVDAVHPPAVDPAKPTPVTLIGRLLPGGTPLPGHPGFEQLTFTVPPAGAAPPSYAVAPPMALVDGSAIRLPGGNAAPVAHCPGPMTMEAEAANDLPGQAQALTVPAEVAGRLEKKLDRDWYSFVAKKGDTLVVELLGDRLGAAADLALRVKSDKDADLAPEADDTADALHPVTFFSRTSDPAPFLLQVPADGVYKVQVAGVDSGVSFGVRAGYWLRVRKPAPDFRAVVMAKSRDWPSPLTIAPGGDAALDVLLHRVDDYLPSVRVTVEGLPPGVEAVPTVIGTGQRFGTLILRAKPDAKPAFGPLRVIVTGEDAAGQPTSRTARPASITWGVADQPRNDIPTVTRLDQELPLAVLPAGAKAELKVAVTAAKIAVKFKNELGQDVEQVGPQLKLGDGPTLGPIVVRPGAKLTLPVSVTGAGGPAAVEIEMTRPGLNESPFSYPSENKPIAVAKDAQPPAFELSVRPNAKPGTYVLVVRAELAEAMGKRERRPPATLARYAQPVHVVILPTALARVSVEPPSGPVKLGRDAELVVKVQRLDGYAGPLELRATSAKSAPGVTFATATIAAGATEGRLKVTVAADAKPGPVALAVEAAGMVQGTHRVTQEAKASFTVVK